MSIFVQGNKHLSIGIFLSTTDNVCKQREVMTEISAENGLQTDTKYNDDDEERQFVELLMTKLSELKQIGVEEGLEEDEIKSILKHELGTLYDHDGGPPSPRTTKRWNFTLLLFVTALAVGVVSIYARRAIGDVRKYKCAIDNNYVVMEITRPVTDCGICEHVYEFKVFDQNVTKEEFAKYAYSGHPMLVIGGCEKWSALKVFNYEFFKKLYRRVEGAYDSVEEECQFFPFKTEFLSLREVFEMAESRSRMLTSDEKSWYIGWSNCNPEVSAILRQHYSRPEFLPDDSELSVIDWIFMGYAGQGASMHLDYVQRPSWQAQIAGSKSWYLRPPPECESVCHAMNVTVKKGDIILIDTNQWYHTTFVEGQEMSITLGSEYD